MQAPRTRRSWQAAVCGLPLALALLAPAGLAHEKPRRSDRTEPWEE